MKPGPACSRPAAPITRPASSTSRAACGTISRAQKSILWSLALAHYRAGQYERARRGRRGAARQPDLAWLSWPVLADRPRQARPHRRSPPLARAGAQLARAGATATGYRVGRFCCAALGRFRDHLSRGGGGDRRGRTHWRCTMILLSATASNTPRSHLCPVAGSLTFRFLAAHFLAAADLDAASMALRVSASLFFSSSELMPPGAALLV